MEDGTGRGAGDGGQGAEFGGRRVQVSVWLTGGCVGGKAEAACAGRGQRGHGGGGRGGVRMRVELAAGEECMVGHAFLCGFHQTQRPTPVLACL